MSRGTVIALADGVGGGPNGRQAAEIALESICSTQWNNSDGKFPISTAISNANRAVCRLASSRGRPATTLAAIFADSLAITGINVGDSRIYDVTDVVPKIVTRDHRSTVNRRAITRFLGGSPAQAVPHSVKLWRGRNYLICSDGLFEFLPTSTLRLDPTVEPEIAISRLISRALAAGSDDNISGVYCTVA
ncbi:PP2C family protein-serine/threonine phosphatase [Qipengyuania flava]|uniref:PP2C family protein-serine/threonine phosphatase n=1 Tax=Qipengyuania flava TaxID=192812 RepID=UPI001CFDEE26